MGLYLAVFQGDDEDVEIAGVEVGSYEDFNNVRALVCAALEEDERGARFPVLMLHSDSDGAWTPAEAATLYAELAVIDAGFAALPAVLPEPGTWQARVQQELGLAFSSLREAIFDVDGEPLVPRIMELCELSLEHGRPIEFQ